MKRQVKELCAKVGVKIEFQTKMKSKQYCEVLKHGPKTLWHFSLRSAVCIPFPGNLVSSNSWLMKLTVTPRCWAWALPCRRLPPSVFCCCSGHLFLANTPSCLIYELLTDGRVLKSPVTTGVCLSILQLYPFLPHVFWHFIVRYIHFENFCVFFRKLTSLSLWNAPLYLWWSLESSEVSA